MVGSDAIAILTIAPFLMLYVAPVVDRWLQSADETNPAPDFWHCHSRSQILEILAQALSVLLAIWLLFGSARAAPYQPLYLLFIPLVWVAVRRGVHGAALTVFAINLGLTLAAWIMQAPQGSLPRLQLAMIALGLTGLCLGAVVNEGKRAEQDLRTSEAGLQEAQRVARLGSWRLEPETGRVTWTEELYRMFDFDPSLPPPRLPDHQRVFTPESWQRLNAEIEDTLRTGVPYELELETIRPDGTTGWIFARGEPQRDDAGDIVAICGIAQDITERKLAEKQVEFLAYYDSLTGLPNRRLLQDRLEKAIAGARRREDKLAVLFFDLDRFKVINDSPGHAVGDLLLQEVARRLQKQTRGQDTVARVGGDEFITVLTGVGNVSDAMPLRNVSSTRLTPNL